MLCFYLISATLCACLYVLFFLSPFPECLKAPIGEGRFLSLFHCLERHIEALVAVRQGTDGDEVHTLLCVRTDGIDGDAAGGLNLHVSAG